MKCPVLAYVLDSENLRLQFMSLIFCAKSSPASLYGFIMFFTLNIS